MGQKMLAVRMATVAVLVSAAPLNARSSQLPAQYFRLLEAGIVRVGEGMDAEPGVSLKTLAARPGWNQGGGSADA